MLGPFRFGFRAILDTLQVWRGVVPGLPPATATGALPLAERSVAGRRVRPLIARREVPAVAAVPAQAPPPLLRFLLHGLPLLSLSLPPGALLLPPGVLLLPADDLRLQVHPTGSALGALSPLGPASTLARPEAAAGSPRPGRPEATPGYGFSSPKSSAGPSAVRCPASKVPRQLRVALGDGGTANYSQRGRVDSLRCHSNKRPEQLHTCGQLPETHGRTVPANGDNQAHGDLGIAHAMARGVEDRRNPRGAALCRVSASPNAESYHLPEEKGDPQFATVAGCSKANRQPRVLNRLMRSGVPRHGPRVHLVRMIGQTTLPQRDSQASQCRPEAKL